MRALALAALTWDPQVKGGLYVLLALVILPGSVYLVLATNTGARVGFQLAAAGLFGFMVIMGVVWWVYAIGPTGPAPTWKPDTTYTGDLARARSEPLRGFPRDWKKLDVASAEVADAQPVVDGALVGDDGPFEESSDYMLVGAFKKGGETFGPFGLDFRPLDVFHKPHYLTVQAQKVIEREVPEGAAPPKPEPDPAAAPVAVVMIRDLGHQRLNPAVATISSLLIFLLLVYQLHTRDKQAMARRSRDLAGTP